jgi:hypothetical protein
MLHASVKIHLNIATVVPQIDLRSKCLRARPRVSRVFQMVYWLASAPLHIHHPISSSSDRPCRPTRMPVTSRVHHHHLLPARPGSGLLPVKADVQRDVPARWRPRLTHNAHPHQLLRRCGSSGARDRGPRLLGPFGRPTGRLAAAAAATASCSRCLRACRLASTSRSTSARSTSGGGHFSATLTPKLNRLSCPGGRSGSAISGRFRMILRVQARVFLLQINLTFWPKF